MEIDEAIKHERWEAKHAGLEKDADDTTIELNRQYHTEIADMLEKLKELRNGSLIAQVVIDKGDLQKMVNEKFKEVELNIRNIREQAIDEFRQRVLEGFRECGFPDQIVWTACYILDDVADKLKK